MYYKILIFIILVPPSLSNGLKGFPGGMSAISLKSKAYNEFL
jgi:hypothetical protein